jgi:transcriptional antiterminator
MGRNINSQNVHYNYKVVVDKEQKLCRTMNDVAEYLSLGRATIQRKLKNPEITLNKYKNRTLEINRCRVPIYGRVQITY